MSRDSVVATEYKKIPWLPLAIIAGVFALAALIYTISLSINPNMSNETANETKNPLPTLTDEEIQNSSPSPHPTFPVPTTYPTLTQDEQQQLLTELEKLNPPQEALDEIRGYPFTEN